MGISLVREKEPTLDDVQDIPLTFSSVYSEKSSKPYKKYYNIELRSIKTCGRWLGMWYTIKAQIESPDEYECETTRDTPGTDLLNEIRTRQTRNHFTVRELVEKCDHITILGYWTTIFGEVTFGNLPVEIYLKGMTSRN